MRPLTFRLAAKEIAHGLWFDYFSSPCFWFYSTIIVFRQRTNKCNTKQQHNLIVHFKRVSCLAWMSSFYHLLPRLQSATCASTGYWILRPVLASQLAKPKVHLQDLEIASVPPEQQPRRTECQRWKLSCLSDRSHNGIMTCLLMNLQLSMPVEI